MCSFQQVLNVRAKTKDEIIVWKILPFFVTELTEKGAGRMFQPKGCNCQKLCN